MVKFIRNKLQVKYYSDNPFEIKQIERALKFYVEGGEFSPAFREGKWDGYMRFYDKYRNFNYGLFDRVAKHLTGLGINWKIQDDFKPIQIISDLNPKLYQHQNEGVKAWFADPFGIIQIPTRAGKTILAAEIIRVGEFDSVIFFVDNQLLLEQAIGDFSKYLHISRDKIGCIQGDTFDIKPITVAMIQTCQSIRFGEMRLKKRNRKAPIALEKLKADRKVIRQRRALFEAYMKDVNLTIVDEVQEYSSEERISVVQMAENIVGQLCLSASPYKSERELDNINIESLAGKIVYKISPQTLKERGILAHEDVLLLRMHHGTNRNLKLTLEDNYRNYEEKIIIKNERRNNILVNVLQICRSLGLKTLVLFAKVPHGKYIQQITGDELVSGETKLDIRITTKDRFLKRKGGVLLATNIFNKGITLPEAEVMINAGGGLERSNVTQKKGRVGGVTDTKKKAIIMDFVDISTYFGSHSLNRIAEYEESIGMENIYVYDTEDDEFYNDIREFLSVWKRG